MVGRIVLMLAVMVTAILFLGVTATPASRTWTVGASAQSDPVLVGAGDIASCSGSGDEATAALLDDIPGTVYTLGDNVYNSGTDAEFANCYDPSWGRHKARTMPSVGNHEYETSGASGYYRYFGSAAGDPSKGYYSYDLGEWHVVVLNSMCEEVGGCGPDSPMLTWLQRDLATNPSSCTLAYWHHSVFSSTSEYGNDPRMIPSWDALYAAGADVVLSGHSHNYERFAPQTSSGVADPEQGIREFVVGSGGKSHYAFGAVQPNSEVRNADTNGVLKLTLHPGSYEWQFVPEAGKTFTDSGTDQCHGAPGNEDTTAPTVGAVAPPDGATGVATTANAEATFSEAMDPATINSSTFTLAKQGVATPVAAAVSYDAATNRATLDPDADLEAGVTYTATLAGGVMDLAGNPLGTDKSWSFVTAAIPPPVDTTPPETTIDSGPSGTVSSSSASFAFSSSEASSTFECSLDGAPYSACTSPISYTNLSNGAHTFDVSARDAAGNVDATPASRTFTVDGTPPPQNSTAPETIIDSGPSETARNNATFTFYSSEPDSTFECKLDWTAFSACSSPTKYTGLAEGLHTFEVRAIDASGNTDPTPASRSWRASRGKPDDLVWARCGFGGSVRVLRPTPHYSPEFRREADEGEREELIRDPADRYSKESPRPCGSRFPPSQE